MNQPVLRKGKGRERKGRRRRRAGREELHEWGQLSSGLLAALSPEEGEADLAVTHPDSSHLPSYKYSYSPNTGTAFLSSITAFR